MVEQWYYMHDGRQAGPVALEELKRLVESGQLRGADEVWKQGTPDWKPVRSVPELAASLPAPAEAGPAPVPAAPAPEGGGSPPGLILWNALVKYGDHSGDYMVLLTAEGVSATPIAAEGKAQPGQTPFSFAWSEIGSAEQRHGFFFWGIVFELPGSGSRCEVWVLYEHQPPTVFRQISEAFPGRTTFRARVTPLWKVVVVPVAVALFFGALGLALYRAVARAEAEGDFSSVPRIFSVLGSGGAAVCAALPVLALCVYLLWLIRRIRQRG